MMDEYFRGNIAPEELKYFVEKAERGEAVLLDCTAPEMWMEISMEELGRKNGEGDTGEGKMETEEVEKWLREKELLK